MTDSEALDLLAFGSATTPFEAQVIAGVLRDAGVPAYVSGGMLTDEFALSQTLLNLQQVEIQVLRCDLGRAQAALAAAKEAGKQLDSDDDGDRQS